MDQQEGTSKVSEGLETIKREMPQTYAAIQRAAKEAGNQVFAVVRAGLRGQPNAFWACERGHVVGTPFDLSPADGDDVARWVVRYGAENLILWAPSVSRVDGDGSRGSPA